MCLIYQENPHSSGRVVCALVSVSGSVCISEVVALIARVSYLRCMGDYVVRRQSSRVREPP